VIKKATGYRFAKTPSGTVLNVPIDILRETEPLHAETMMAADWQKIMKELVA
jgi:hypothetical protein